MVHEFWQEGSSDDQLLDQLQQAQEEAGKWRREAYEEANRREKAEKAVIEATRKVKLFALKQFFIFYFTYHFILTE